MELDELKNTWAALDKQLKDNNAMNETIIMKMAQKKADKSLSKLIFWDEFSIAVLLLMIPFIVYWFTTHHMKYIFWNVTMIYAGIFCVIFSVWYIIKVHGLMKIDVTKDVGSNIYYMNRYNIQVKREKFAMKYFFGPLFGLFIIVAYAEINVKMSLWVFLACLLILASVTSIWGYKKLYQKNIDSILDSLEELKELDED